MTLEPAEPARTTGLLSRLWRRRRVFLIVAGSIMALAVVALIILPVSYMASGSVIVTEPEPGVNTSPAAAQKVGDPADLESQLLMLSSPRIIRLALAMPGVLDLVLDECAAQLGFFSSRARCEKLRTDSQALFEFVQPHYGFGNVGRSRVLNVSYQASKPEIAQKMVNALIEAFLEDQRSALAASREQAAKWLWKETNQLDAELRREEAKIQEFRRAKGLVRGTAAPIGSERLTSVSQQLSTAEGALADADARLKEINADRINGTTNSPSVLASRTVSDLKSQLTAIEVQVAAAGNALGSLHPTLRALEQERATVKQRLRAEIAAVAESIKKDRDAAKALVESLKRKMDTVKDDVGLATLEEGSVENMVRSAELKRKQYSDLYKRASELETEKRILLGSVRLVNLAELPTKPFFPKRIPFLAAGLTVACLLGAAAAILRDHLDKSVRTSSELAVLTGEKLCVELPRLRPKSESMRASIFGSPTDPPLEIALRLAQDDASLQNALYDLGSALDLEEFKAVAITSKGEGDGKTFTTLSLAQLIADHGYAVLVVECDAKNPCFEKVLNLESGPGLIDVLEGSVPFADAVAATSFPNVDALPIGAVGEVVKPNLFKGLRDALDDADAYDLVLLDCAPAETLETRIIARRASCVLYCAKWGGELADDARNSLKRLRAAGGDVLGVVITKAVAGGGWLADDLVERLDRRRTAA